MFVITANAAEPAGDFLDQGMSSGDVIGLSTISAGHGSLDFLSERFAVCGQNIKKIKITTDKCCLYTTVPVYSGDPDYEKAVNGDIKDLEEYDPIYVGDAEYDGYISHYEHSIVAGTTYKGTYNENMYFGMSVPRELWSTNEDPKQCYHETVDQVDGATITIAVTFTDGSTEEHQYRLRTGKIFVPVDEKTNLLLWNHLTRFLTPEEKLSGEVPYAYGYLMKKMD